MGPRFLETIFGIFWLGCSLGLLGFCRVFYGFWIGFEWLFQSLSMAFKWDSRGFSNVFLQEPGPVVYTEAFPVSLRAFQALWKGLWRKTLETNMGCTSEIMAFHCLPFSRPMTERLRALVSQNPFKRHTSMIVSAMNYSILSTCPQKQQNKSSSNNNKKKKWKKTKYK